MNHINLFLVLVIILVVLLFVLVILLVTFRESFANQCCRGRRGSNSTPATTHRTGLRNPAFDVHEHPVAVIQRPFSNMEATESPPSYEEAVKQELFRFRSPTSLKSRPNALGDVVSSDRDSPSTSFAAEASVVDSSLAIGSNTNSSQPSTSQGSQSSRPRSATTNSCLASSLSTIEEESEESSVTVVIDCIGIQASRLMENCDTSVDLAGGCELATHSKC